MSDVLSPSGAVLYVWPGQWDLPSFDPFCLAAILCLQLTIPGEFTVTETSNPDTSPTGQLPYLVHEQHVISSLSSIIEYVSALRNADQSSYPNTNLDIDVSNSDRAKTTAWSAHAESHLGDLVYHTLYAVDENWMNFSGPMLASLYPVPQKYYVPRRIRDSYFLKLQAAGLWKSLVEPRPRDKPFQKDGKAPQKEELKKNEKVTQTFEREKVVQKARAEFELYEELLHGKNFVFHNGPSVTDLIIAAHTLLLLRPPYPDPLFKNIILESYPTLSSHAERIHGLAFGQDSPGITTISSSTSSLWGLVPSWPKGRTSLEDERYNRMGWGFFGIVIGSLAAYIAVVGSQVKPVGGEAERQPGEGASAKTGTGIPAS